MAAQNHTNFPVRSSFGIGVEVDLAGRIDSFAHGEIDAGIAMRVADELVQLAYVIRNEVRKDVVLSADI